MKLHRLCFGVFFLLLLVLVPACAEDGGGDDFADDDDDEDDDDDDEEPIDAEDVCPALCESMQYCRSIKGQVMGVLKDCEQFCAQVVAENEVIELDQTALACHELTECAELEGCLAGGTFEVDYISLCTTYCERVTECWPGSADFDEDTCKEQCQDGTDEDFATCVLYYEDCNEMKDCQIHTR